MVKEINIFEQEMGALTEPLEQQAYFPGILEQVRNAEQERQKEKLVRQEIKRIVEALLFACSDPISFSKIREIVETHHPLKPRALRETIEELQHDYLFQNRAFRLEEIAHGFLLRTCEEHAEYIDLLYRNKRSEKISQASAEVLAIIAYKQPVTRPQIEAIRGVDSSGIVQNLLERQLIEPLGKLEAPGRPTLYGITKDFLKHFGLRDLQDLQRLASQD